ncbi:hypothetical protein DITRI_Ditri09bG0060600 [Diplodiscus trichospermus]
MSKHTRHLSYIVGKYDGIKKFKGIIEAQHLRTFLPLSPLLNYGWCFVSNDLLTHLLPNLRCLRVLSLAGYGVVELSDFIGDLKHLRYLDFSRTLIGCLPESISTLFNLETLLLRECQRLEKLPSKMENLVNLCYLDITGACGLESMPSNFSTLSDLQTLSNFVLQEDKGCQIRELENLSNLKGELCISGLKNAVETQDACKAKLHDKPRLDKLELKWGRNFEFKSWVNEKKANRRWEIEEKVLDLLQPSKMLKELALDYYCGVRFAKWIGDPSFNNLLSLCLEDCQNCTSLPSIGQLPLLKKVCIMGLHSVTSVGVEFFGKNASNAFPSLEGLQFEDMPKWKNWNFIGVDEKARKFPKLRELFIVRCSELSGSIPECLPSLEKLIIHVCDKLAISIQSLPMLSVLDIYMCHKVVYKGFADGSSLKRVCFSYIPKFTCAAEWLTTSVAINVESLEIEDCEELCSLRENNWRFLTQPMALGTLSIQRLSQIVSMGVEEEREELMQLKIPSSIQQLKIKNCERLEKLATTLRYVTSLSVLELWSCPKLISLSKNNLPLNLKSLVIHDCENLLCLLVEEEDGNISNDCLLEQVNIQNCPKLIYLSNNNLPLNLKQLDIYKCPSLVSLSSRGKLPASLKQLRLQHCANLESIAQEIQNNSSLEFILILNCRYINNLPQGLNKLGYLREMYIHGCSNLVSFSENGLPTSSLKVLRLDYCGKLQALPDGIHNLNCLEELAISDCSSVRSFPEQGIPTNLRRLTIAGPNICKPVIQWGLHRLTSLQYLSISNGCPDAVSFPQEEIGMMLPYSLIRLNIISFPKLKILSSKGFQNLTSLEYLCICSCPNLKSLPKKDMLSSLLQLYIRECPMLKERCEKDKGPEWSKIAHIPCVQIDGRYIYESS